MYQFENVEETIVTFESTNCSEQARNFLIDNIRKGKWKTGSEFLFIKCTQVDQEKQNFLVKDSKNE